MNRSKKHSYFQTCDKLAHLETRGAHVSGLFGPQDPDEKEKKKEKGDATRSHAGSQVALGANWVCGCEHVWLYQIIH